MNRNTRRRLCSIQAAAGMVILVAIFLLTGCVFQTVREQQAIIETACTISGTVSTSVPGKHPLVVVLIRFGDSDRPNFADWKLHDHFVLEGPGRFLMRVGQGTYGLAAFEDRNEDLKYEPGEPYLRVDPERLIACSLKGEVYDDIALKIPKTGAPRIGGVHDITALQARTVADQFSSSLGLVIAAGKVTTLDDPRFSEENAESGLWKPFDFLFTAGPGVYFLEPYQPNKIPVLFVHGMNGTPKHFRFLIEHLDGSKFQPWIAFYPSGASLVNVSGQLSQVLRKLQRIHGFKRFYIVAHSMGGLVSRGVILKYYETPHAAEIPQFITISTPWGGHKAAEMGVKHAPAVVKVWYDMAPDSAYLRSIFYKDPDTRKQRRTLPPEVTHHLLFTFKRNSTSFGESDDEAVTVASEMYPPAQEDAYRMYGFNLTHRGVLKDAQVSELLNDLLAGKGH